MDPQHDAWLAPLSAAYDAPREVAGRWHAAGGHVVGVLGQLAPRELVLAGGMLPIRLSPTRLEPAAAVPADRTAALEAIRLGLAGELPPGPLDVLCALLDGRLDWIDALLIGRDSEAHTKFFYVLRELAADPEHALVLRPFAFADVLRLPARTSAVYNRRRIRQLRDVVADWAGRPITDSDLADAIERQSELAEQLHALQLLRVDGRVAGSEMFVACAAAQTMPATDAIAALGAGVAACRERPVSADLPRIFLTGSEIDDDEPYTVLESVGLAVIGEDHGWGVPPAHGSTSVASPCSWIADRYQLSPVGPARAGLERVEHTVRAAVAARADAVVQLVLEDDEASEWELGELRRLLQGLPVLSVGLGGDAGTAALQRAAHSLRIELQAEQASEPERASV